MFGSGNTASDRGEYTLRAMLTEEGSAPYPNIFNMLSLLKESVSLEEDKSIVKDLYTTVIRLSLGSEFSTMGIVFNQMSKEYSHSEKPTLGDMLHVYFDYCDIIASSSYPEQLSELYNLFAENIKRRSDIEDATCFVTMQKQRYVDDEPKSRHLKGLESALKHIIDVERKKLAPIEKEQEMMGRG